MFGIALTQVQVFALDLNELMRFTQAHFSSLSQSFWMASLCSRMFSHIIQLGVIHKLAEGALNLTVHVADKDVE